jgi:hypothetical protein
MRNLVECVSLTHAIFYRKVSGHEISKNIPREKKSEDSSQVTVQAR